MLFVGLGARFDYDNMDGLPALWQRFTPYIGHVPNEVKGVAYGVVDRERRRRLRLHRRCGGDRIRRPRSGADEAQYPRPPLRGVQPQGLYLGDPHRRCARSGASGCRARAAKSRNRPTLERYGVLNSTRAPAMAGWKSGCRSRNKKKKKKGKKRQRQATQSSTGACRPSRAAGRA